jgi:hypothetical protein
VLTVVSYPQFVAVLLESLRVPVSHQPYDHDDYLHQEMSAKSLLVMAKYRGNHLKVRALVLLLYHLPYLYVSATCTVLGQNLTEVLTDKLCHAASTCALPIAQAFEVILSEFAKYDAPRLVRAVAPYATFDKEPGGSAVRTSDISDNPQVRLLSLRVICNSVRFFSSATLLQQLPTLVPVVLSSINSPLPDLRKAVVFILVEMYLSVGDSVFPYIHSLTPPQRKLMTIYVEKRMNERKHIVATALTN